MRPRESGAAVDGYGWFGSDEGEEMWVLELVTFVSVPWQQSRRWFLFRMKERCCTEGNLVQTSLERAGFQGTAGPGQGLLPATQELV